MSWFEVKVKKSTQAQTLLVHHFRWLIAQLPANQKPRMPKKEQKSFATNFDFASAFSSNSRRKSLTLHHVDRAEKFLRMRHFRPSRHDSWRENIYLSNAFRMKNSRVSWLRSKISVSVQVWKCSVQEICLSTLTGRSFAKVWSLSGLPKSYLR